MFESVGLKLLLIVVELMFYLCKITRKLLVENGDAIIDKIFSKIVQSKINTRSRFFLCLGEKHINIVQKMNL